MEKLLAFHGDPKVKAKYLKRVDAHAKHDEIVKGLYWERGKGCAVGCTIHDADHMKYETELGIPAIIAYLEDCLFEELPNGTAKAFPKRFLEAITPGADLSLVCAKFMIWQFEDKKYGIKYIPEVKEDKELLKVCTDVVKAYKRVLKGEVVTEKEWEDLEERAWAGAGAWAGAWAGAGAGARAWAWAWAWAWAGAGAWARAWAGAGAWAGEEYDKLYQEAIIATSEKLLELLKEAK